MSNSRDINYVIRPAKGVERKMLAELCSRLRTFRALSEYQYVGYGGAYFCDFSLFHRALNIQDMVSIEYDKPGAMRYEFNKPFRCVRMEFGNARDVLPNLDWSKPSVLWMDEIGSLSEDLIDVFTSIVRQLKTGSVALLTVAATRLDGADNPMKIASLRKQLGRFSPDLSDSELDGPKLQMRLFDVLCQEAQKILDKCYGFREGVDRMHFVPLINFGYRDGKRMSTWGGIVLSNTMKENGLSSFVKDLPFLVLSTTQPPYDIEVPNLSLKEVQRLNECLPSANIDDSRLMETGLVENDIRAYEQIYRYYPHLSEIIA